MPLTSFELSYLAVEPFVMPLHREVRRRLRRLARTRQPFDILDVGGRKSHYTVGVPAHVTISDLPRETEVQKALRLGITDGIIAETRRRRSNIRDIVFDDMTASRLPSSSFDCVVAVEVLEHVAEDERFVQEVCRVLKPGGTFLMTTPNGDSVRNSNPDHKRHYTRQQLTGLLASIFGRSNTAVEYAVCGGRFRKLGLRPWQISRPVYTAAGMFGNVINGIQSSRELVKEQANGTKHLLATARKA